MRLGLVTYQLAKGWDVEEIIANCEETGFEAVELRTTHAHGVEVQLSATQRNTVRKRFETSNVQIAGLGSAFEYDSTELDEVRRNIEETKDYVRLASDIGAPGVKVRPNRVHDDEGVPREQTFAQIGHALAECGDFAREFGVEIRLEVHGLVTCEPRNIRTIIDCADSDNVFVCWNSNPQDVNNGSIDANFALLQEKIRLVHITELWNDYPWTQLFKLLRDSAYQGFCLAEVSESADALRLMRYYRALWVALQPS